MRLAATPTVFMLFASAVDIESVNDDVRKARLELARGNRDGARVHAWNALVTADPEDYPLLWGLAEDLGDDLLVNELEWRGARPPKPEAEPKRRRPRITSLLLPLAIVILLAFLALTTISTEARAPQPRADAPGILPPGGRPMLEEHDGIWLVQVGASRHVALRKLADDLTFRYGYPVGVLPEIVSLPRAALDGNRDALDGDFLLDFLARWYAARGRATVIGVTDYDMFSTQLDLNHPFMLRAFPHYAVVSTADLGATVFARLRGHTRYERTRKLAARAIGFLYLRRPVSPDSHSLLRSQMGGVDEIDDLDERL